MLASQHFATIAKPAEFIVPPTPYQINVQRKRAKITWVITAIKLIQESAFHILPSTTIVQFVCLFASIITKNGQKILRDLKQNYFLQSTCRSRHRLSILRSRNIHTQNLTGELP